MVQLGRRSLNQLRQRIAHVVSRHLPAGATVLSITSRNTGKFRFKHALRLQLKYRKASGQKKTTIIHANVPSQDTQHEARVADQIERRLTSSGRFNGAFRSPRSFGILREGPANLYQDVPGRSLQSLLTSNPRRAKLIAGRTADWLGQLYALRLSLGQPRPLERIELEIGYFTDNFSRVDQTAVEPAWLTLRAAVRSQFDLIKKYHQYFRTIHGDMNLGNMIDSGQTMAMIDFGNSHIFDPASDAGNFLAQLDIMHFRGDLSATSAKRLQAAFLRRWRRVSGLGPHLLTRVSLHRAWWVLQVSAYTCATEPRTGRRIIPPALQFASKLLTAAGYRPSQKLELISKTNLPTGLNDLDTMTAFFRARLKQYFPNDRALDWVTLVHQPALSTTSYLMRYSLMVTDDHGRSRKRIIRGNSVEPATVHFVQYVKQRARTFETMRPLELLQTHRYFFYEELAGQPLRNIALNSPAFDQALPKIASALASFHQLPISPVRQLSLQQEAKLLQAVQHNIKRYGHGCLPEYRAVAAQLFQAERKHWQNFRRPVHNDFQASNILVTKGGIGIIDYTLSGLGHPAIDVANFLTHLSVMLHGHRRQSRITQAQNRFLRAYLSRFNPSHRQAIRQVLPVFQLRSALDILSTTVVNLGPRDPNRAIYVRLLVEHIRTLLPSLT